MKDTPGKLLEAYEVIVTLNIYRKPYCVDDFTSLVTLFNEMHEQEMQIAVVKTKQTIKR
jgi:CBS domain containing-hemolysin-like protein